MLYYLINTIIIICVAIGWIGIIGAISTQQHTFGLYGAIACFIALGLVYYKDWRHWDQDEDEE
jgi:hypothetical protein